MISIEDAKNQEDLFQIKSAIMSKKLEDVGGRKGVSLAMMLAMSLFRTKWNGCFISIFTRIRRNR